MTKLGYYVFGVVLILEAVITIFKIHTSSTIDEIIIISQAVAGAFFLLEASKRKQLFMAALGIVGLLLIFESLIFLFRWNYYDFYSLINIWSIVAGIFILAAVFIANAKNKIGLILLGIFFLFVKGAIPQFNIDFLKNEIISAIYIGITGLIQFT
ncbi:MAG: hypothetical protein JXA68_07090, partial [Ignavibacteriales bacterium]|nr:hypothetical protein [Ignavibacteriales bacterium]